MSLRIVGIIGKTHGTGGEVMVRWITDYPKTFKKGDVLFTSQGKKKLTVENIREKQVKGKKIPLIKFSELRNADEACRYRQDYLWRAHSPELDENHYWLDDLAGCSVYEGDAFIGIVEQALDCPANQVLVIGLKSRKSIMVPFIDTYIESVDTEKKKIILKSLPQYI